MGDVTGFRLYDSIVRVSVFACLFSVSPFKRTGWPPKKILRVSKCLKIGRAHV